MNFWERFIESDAAEFIHQITMARWTTEPWEIWLSITLISLPFLLLAYLLISIKIDKKQKEKIRSKGTYFKELPIKEIEISFQSERSFALLYKTKTVRTPSAQEYENSLKANKQTKLDLFRTVISLIPKEEACFAKKYGDFRLEAEEEWLSGYETFTNVEGYTVAIRGADEKLAEYGCDIFVPKASADELSEMTLTELSKFYDEENCKLQIKENGSKIVFSDVEGYTETDIIRAISEVAEKKGITVI